MWVNISAMCDIAANGHINVIKVTFNPKHWLHGHNMSYRTYRLCPFITFLALNSGLATNNPLGYLLFILQQIFFTFIFRQ